MTLTRNTQNWHFKCKMFDFKLCLHSLMNDTKLSENGLVHSAGAISSRESVMSVLTLQAVCTKPEVE